MAKKDYITFHHENIIRTAASKAGVDFTNLCAKELGHQPDPYIGIKKEDAVKLEEALADICDKCGRSRDGHSLAIHMHESRACEKFQGAFIK
jgi:hypothetical protein